MSPRKFLFLAFSVVAMLSASSVALLSCDRSKPGSESNEDFNTKVRFANLPYGDHTFSIIGKEKGFFADEGIDVDIKTIKIEEVVSSLANGSYDVASVPPGILFSSWEDVPNIVTFCFSDLFQGFALMADPRKGYKSVEDFKQSGASHSEAIKLVARQIKGKTWAYPTETAVKPFIDLVLSRGEVARTDFKSMVLDDPLTVQALKRGEADFQVGGVPSRITLQRDGFIPLLTSVDFATGAKPSKESAELAAILQNGWACTKEYYDKNHATVLKLAKVNYKIMEFMHTDRKEAMEIHMKYLSKVTGETFTAEVDGPIIYDDLNPFYRFEDQLPWFEDSSSPFYYAHVNGAILQSFINSGIYEETPPTVEDIIFADDIYRKLKGEWSPTDRPEKE